MAHKEMTEQMAGLIAKIKDAKELQYYVESTNMLKRHLESHHTDAAEIHSLREENAYLKSQLYEWTDCTEGEPTYDISSVAVERAALKRKAETQLFDERKRMRVMKKAVLPELDTYSRADSHQYFSIVHNHVLRIAARGGLINLTHFEVGQYGQICLSKEGLERAELFDKHQTHRKVIEATLPLRIGKHQTRFGTYFWIMA